MLGLVQNRQHRRLILRIYSLFIFLGSKRALNILGLAGIEPLLGFF